MRVAYVTVHAVTRWLRDSREQAIQKNRRSPAKSAGRLLGRFAVADGRDRSRGTSPSTTLRAIGRPRPSRPEIDRELRGFALDRERRWRTQSVSPDRYTTARSARFARLAQRISDGENVDSEAARASEGTSAAASVDSAADTHGERCDVFRSPVSDDEPCLSRESGLAAITRQVS